MLNWLSTGDFVPPSSRLKQDFVSSVLCKKTKEASPKEEHEGSHPTLPDPDLPLRFALRPDPPVICLAFPRHAVHEKSLQKQKGACELVSSQERRALAVLLVNRG